MFSTCEQLAKNLSALEDGEVNGVRRTEATLHLSWCTQCRAYVAQFREVRRQLAAQATTTADVDGEARAMSVFDAWADAADADTDGDSSNDNGSTT